MTFRLPEPTKVSASAGPKTRHALWLCSTAVVIAARLLAPSDPSFDLGIQLQATHNLLAGHGLSVYQHLSQNLRDPADLITLTYFPSGYSLLAAALMRMGFGVGAAMKALGALGTILGWWGWARLSAPFVDGAWQRGRLWKFAVGAIAAFTPLLFTPPWGGTDLFLWAIVPWLVVCLVRASDERTSGGRWFDLLAGALCGLALLMRYASLFLVIYAAGVVLWQTWPRVPLLIRRALSVGAGALPALAFQGFINYIVSTARVSPGGLLDDARASMLARLSVGAQLIRHADYFWAFWFPGTISSRLFAAGIAAPPWRLALTPCALVSLLLAIAIYVRSSSDPRRDVRIAALGLFAAVPLTLLACMLLSSTNYLAERRYYWPIVPLSVLAAGSIASLVDIPRDRRAMVLFQRACAIYLVGYVGMMLVYVGFLFVPGRIGTSQREKLLGEDVQRWPSNGITHESSDARRLAMQLAAAHPGSLLLTGRAGAFYWDPRVDGSRLWSLSCERTQPLYADGPTTLIIMTFDRGEPRDLWYYRGNAVLGSLRRATCFEAIPNLELVQRFPAEGLKVLQANISAGDRVILAGPAPLTNRR